MLAKESKTRPSIFSDIMHPHPLNRRKDITEGSIPFIPWDYSVSLHVHMWQKSEGPRLMLKIMGFFVFISRNRV